MSQKVVLTMVFCFSVSLLASLGAPSQESDEDYDDYDQEESYEEDLDEEMVDQFLYELEEHLTMTLDEEGTLPVEGLDGDEEELGSDLELIEILDDEAVEYAEETYFAPVVMEGMDEDEEVVEYELDVFMMFDDEEDTWEMDRILLHKIDAEEEFTYMSNNPIHFWSLDGEEKGETTEHPVNYWELDEEEYYDEDDRDEFEDDLEEFGDELEDMEQDYEELEEDYDDMYDE
jgi:hypothetical protein